MILQNDDIVPLLKPYSNSYLMLNFHLFFGRMLLPLPPISLIDYLLLLLMENLLSILYLALLKIILNYAFLVAYVIHGSNFILLINLPQIQTLYFYWVFQNAKRLSLFRSHHQKGLYFPSSHRLFLSQRKYIINLLGCMGIIVVNPSPSPLVVTQHLHANMGTPLAESKDYQAAVGSPQYLTLTRPNVAFAVNRVSQFMHRPTIDHWATLKRLLSYLSDTLDKGFTIYRDS